MEQCCVCKLQFSTDPNVLSGVFHRNTHNNTFICPSCFAQGFTYCEICWNDFNESDPNRNFKLLPELIPYHEHPYNHLDKSLLSSSMKVCSNTCYNINVIDKLTVPYSMILTEHSMGVDKLFKNANSEDRVNYAKEALSNLQAIRSKLQSLQS